MFYTAEITFSDPETMELVMTDSVVARDREHELVRVLEKIFCERCGFNLKVHPAYRKPVESKGRKNSELRILEEARQILLHSKVGNKNSDREAGEDLSGQGMEAPFDEGRMIGADGKEQRPQGKINRIRTQTVENSQQLHRKKEKRGTKAVSGIETVEKMVAVGIFRKVVTAMDHVL